MQQYGAAVRADGLADADSRVRSVTVTSMMFIMPMPPTMSDMLAMPPSRILRMFVTDPIASSMTLME